MEHEALKQKAYEYAMFLLNIRLRTEGELREKMGSNLPAGKAGKYESRIINEVIERLKNSHYIDDQRFAEVYLENLKKYKTWGYFGIKKKLMEKRLPMGIIEAVLAEGLTEEEEIKIVKRVIKKYKLETGNYEGKQKLAQKLRAKGFRASVVFKF